MNLAPASLSVRDGPVPDPDWEDTFLDWFSGLGYPLIEKRLKLGGLEYTHFTTAFPVADGREITSHGRSRDRKQAAVKCVAEFAERTIMVEECQWVSRSSLRLPHPIFPPARLWTSNGWAVQRTPELARRAALREALERHLLLKSYLAFGWAGFRLIGQLDADQARVYLLTARFQNRGQVAGLAVAKSPLYPGVALGYTLADARDLEQASFWEPALFEACDKILTLSGRPVDRSRDPHSWLLSGIRHYLETPFQLELLEQGRNSAPLQDLAQAGQAQTYDLRDHLRVDFPIYAASSWGGTLIPLFHGPALGSKERAYLDPILAENGIGEELPERHPVL